MRIFFKSLFVFLTTTLGPKEGFKLVTMFLKKGGGTLELLVGSNYQNFFVHVSLFK
jgi:hypothetical protein